MNLHLATPATTDAGIALRLRRLVRAAADVYGVTPADLGPGRQGRHPGGVLPPHVAARYAVLLIATERRIGIWADALEALGYVGRKSSISLHGQVMRAFCQRATDDADTIRRLDQIRARLDRPMPVASPAAATVDPDAAAVFGPHRVTGQRLRDLRRRGWTIGGLARHYEIDEGQVRRVLRETTGGTA